MFQMSNSLLSKFDTISFDKDVDNLCKKMSSEDFVSGLSKLGVDKKNPENMREIAINLIEQASELGFKNIGDVTPFCLFRIYDSTELKQESIYNWIIYIIESTSFSAEKRMDAVFSLLPSDIRVIIFNKN